MARSLDKALLNLLARLRAPRRGPASLMLLGWVLLAQTALVVHRIDPQRGGSQHGLRRLASRPISPRTPASAPVFVSIPQAPTPVIVSVTESAGTPTLLSYRSRAPPERSLA